MNELKAEIDEIRRVCHNAWEKGLMAGWSGNASIKTENGIVITTSGTPKGFLNDQDFLLIDMQASIVAGWTKPSSETLLHLELYRAYPSCRAIFHTHPACLQALAIKMGGLPDYHEEFLNLPLYEAEMWKPRLFFGAAFPAGSREVALNAVDACEGRFCLPCAIWLERHGLAACGEDLRQAFCLTEELEHLAKVQLLSGEMPAFQFSR